VVIARLVPAQAHPLADLIAAGVLHTSTRTGPIPRPTGPVHTDSEAGAVLSAMRDEEHY
jgi:hypothetical protein